MFPPVWYYINHQNQSIFRRLALTIRTLHVIINAYCIFLLCNWIIVVMKQPRQIDSPLSGLSPVPVQTRPIVAIFLQHFQSFLISVGTIVWNSSHWFEYTPIFFFLKCCKVYSSSQSCYLPGGLEMLPASLNRDCQERCYLGKVTAWMLGINLFIALTGFIRKGTTQY